MIAAQQVQHADHRTEQQQAHERSLGSVRQQPAWRQFADRPTLHQLDQQQVGEQRRQCAHQELCQGMFEIRRILAAPAQDKHRAAHHEAEDDEQQGEDHDARQRREHQPAFPARCAGGRDESNGCVVHGAVFPCVVEMHASSRS